MHDRLCHQDLSGNSHHIGLARDHDSIVRLKGYVLLLAFTRGHHPTERLDQTGALNKRLHQLGLSLADIRLAPRVGQGQERIAL